LVSLTACGNDTTDDDADNSNPTAQITSIPRDPLPTIEGRTITNVAKGYHVTYPEGWEPRFDLAVAPGQKLDAFFAPPRTNETLFRASITIVCEQISTSEDSRGYYERKREVTESTAEGEIIGPQQVSIGGVPGLQIEYVLDAGDQEVRKVDVFAATATCGYTVSLASSPEELGQHLPSWRSFLATLTFS
jgi:hypothetical protein